MFYEAKEGLAVSLDSVRSVRISQITLATTPTKSEDFFHLELLYTNKTVLTVKSSAVRDDLLPAYRTILKLLGCGETETQEPPCNATCANCGLAPTKCYCGQYRPQTCPATPS